MEEDVGCPFRDQRRWRREGWMKILLVRIGRKRSNLCLQRASVGVRVGLKCRF